MSESEKKFKQRSLKGHGGFKFGSKVSAADVVKFFVELGVDSTPTLSDVSNPLAASAMVVEADFAEDFCGEPEYAALLRGMVVVRCW